MRSATQNVRSISKGFDVPSRNSPPEFLAFRVVSSQTRQLELFGSLISLAIHFSLIAIFILAPSMFVQRMNRPQHATYLADTSELYLPRTIAARPASNLHLQHTIGARPRQGWKHDFMSGHWTAPSGLKSAQPMAQPEETPILSVDSIGQTDLRLPGGVLEGMTGGLGAPPPTTESPDVPLRIGGSIKAPHLVYSPAPEYPRSALEAQVQGDVRIDAVVDKNGNVIVMNILQGPSMLTAAALKAVGRWRYEPTCINGTLYPIEVIVGVSFRLLDSGDEAWGYLIG